MFQLLSSDAVVTIQSTIFYKNLNIALYIMLCHCKNKKPIGLFHELPIELQESLVITSKRKGDRNSESLSRRNVSVALKRNRQLGIRRWRGRWLRWWPTHTCGRNMILPGVANWQRMLLICLMSSGANRQSSNLWRSKFQFGIWVWGGIRHITHGQGISMSIHRLSWWSILWRWCCHWQILRCARCASDEFTWSSIIAGIGHSCT